MNTRTHKHTDTQTEGRCLEKNNKKRRETGKEEKQLPFGSPLVIMGQNESK